MSKILVTGFEAFGKVAVNPSQKIVEALSERGDLITAVLPVAYESAAEKIIHLIESYQPKAVLMLGVAQKRPAINLERIAININDASIADNEGKLVTGQAIITDAPVGYWSTLPLEAFYTALKSANIPVTHSNHAGAYLCNHVFYRIQHYYAQQGLKIPAGFIHLPDIGDTEPNLPLETMQRAVELCIEQLRALV